MIVPFYDEFCVYTTQEDVEFYVESLIKSGIETEKDIYHKCIEYFGQDFSRIIEYIVYGED